MPLIRVSSETEINVVSSGNKGPALIFLHFWGGSSRTFSAVISSLPPELRTVRIDFRGWGDSTGPQSADGYSIKDLATDVETIIRKIGINDFILIGHSMGGKVAQLVGGRGIVKGLKGLILIGSAPPTPLVLPENMRETQVTAYSTRESAEFVVRNVLTSSPPSEETITSLVDDMTKGNTFATAAWPSYAMAEDITAEVKNIEVPVLVIGAEFDLVEPLEKLQKNVVGNIPTAGISIIRGSGHLIPVEAPKQVSQCILQFVNRISPSSKDVQT